MAGVAPAEFVNEFFRAADAGEVKSFAPLLPLFRMGEDHLSTELHFQMAPMYNFEQPRTSVYMCGRQVGKTAGFTTQTILRGHFYRGFHTLIIEPRADQLQRYNQTILKPILRDCLIQDQMIRRPEIGNFFVKEMNSGSIIYLEYCYISPDRVRGISAIQSVTFDESQDLNYDFIPVIEQVMAASRRFGFRQFTGTPKTSDGTLAVLWADSSMAEWVIPCGRCSKLNVPSIDHDLIKMIGKKGLSCAKCGRLVDARRGYYEHARPERRAVHAGYHVSQVVHPLHYAIPAKWQALLERMEGPGSYSKAKFYNEVLGVPCDENVKLLSQEDLIAAATKARNTVDAAAKVRNQYEGYILGVDWSGGGELDCSYTAYAVAGFRAGTDVLDCLLAGKLPIGMSPEDESAMLLKLFRDLGCVYLAHDFGGAGYIRESLMRQAGLPTHQIIPFTYVHSTQKDVISYNPPTSGGQRFSYSIDKARSLAIICAALRNKKVSLPAYDEESRKTLDDLLNLVELPRELPHGNTIYLIGRAPKKPDDFAHALNFACSAVWYTRQAYPELSGLSRKFQATPEQMALAAPPDPANTHWQ